MDDKIIILIKYRIFINWSNLILNYFFNNVILIIDYSNFLLCFKIIDCFLNNYIYIDCY